MQIINVVCVVLNQPDVEETIRSFASQNYKNKRLIIIDGGSRAETLDVIYGHSHSIDFFLTEPDKGISDAFNKAIDQCRPGYVYFLGAGDTFCSRDSLKSLVEGCDYRRDFLVCGKIKRITKTGKLVFLTPKSLSFSKKSLLFKMSLPHQALLTSTEYFRKHGKFDLGLKYSMDYELLLRSYHEFPDVVMKDVHVAHWVEGGVGSGQIKKVYHEYHKIKEKNQVASYVILILINYYILLKFHIKRLVVNG